MPNPRKFISRSVPLITSAFVLSLFLVGCGGGPQFLRQECLSKDDTECAQAAVKRPANPNLKTGRAEHPRSLVDEIKDLRTRDTSLPRQLTYLVEKSERRLTVKLGDRVVRTYGVSLGFQPVGHKAREADGRTPEGTYYVVYKAPPKGSMFYRSLLVSYPNLERADEGLKAGVITQREHGQIKRAQKRCGMPPQRTALGGYILIHTGGGGAGYSDWTLGCVALTDSDMVDLHLAARAGCRNGEPRTKLVIKP